MGDPMGAPRGPHGAPQAKFPDPAGSQGACFLECYPMPDQACNEILPWEQQTYDVHLRYYQRNRPFGPPRSE